MDWDDFRGRLQATLRDVADRCYVVVSAPGKGGYVQLAGFEDSLAAEASGPEFVAAEAAHAADDPTMVAAGWVAPTRSQPNWSCELALPALTSDYAALADRCVVALRDVFHIGDPAALSYRAWRDPESQPSGETWSPDRVAELDPGENPLPLPGLGLQPQSA